MQNVFKLLGFTVFALLVAVPAFARNAAPEIDPTVAVSGLTALVGGVLVLMGRHRN